MKQSGESVIVFIYNLYSFFNNPNQSDEFFDYISSEEKIRTAKEILVFLYTLDDQHVIEHLKRDLNGKILNDVQTDLETWKQEILSLISLDE